MPNGGRAWVSSTYKRGRVACKGVGYTDEPSLRHRPPLGPGRWALCHLNSKGGSPWNGGVSTSRERKLGEDSMCLLPGHPWDLLPISSLDRQFASRTPCTLPLLIRWHSLFSMLGWIFAPAVATPWRPGSFPCVRLPRVVGEQLWLLLLFLWAGVLSDLLSAHPCSATASAGRCDQ